MKTCEKLRFYHIGYTYFSNIEAKSIAIDDVTNQITRKIFNAN